MKESYYLVLDIGTSGVKALVFDSNFSVVSKAYKKLNKTSFLPGWVEQDPQALIQSSIFVIQNAITQSGVNRNSLVGLGITNQRETTILWDKNTGHPVYEAIVWEDNRTEAYCQEIKNNYGKIIRYKTGLEVNSYYSASKIKWILDKIDNINENLAFGTVDSWVIFNLIKNKTHLTDWTNASRTMLFNIQTKKWDEELLKIFKIPQNILPQVLQSTTGFGQMIDGLKILVVVGDQESSMFAAGASAGTTKVTYGTGTFISQIIGSEFRNFNNFNTTLTVDGQFMIEAKIEGTAQKIDHLLSVDQDLEPAVREICKEVDKYIQALPNKPSEIIIDGGITQYEKLKEIQEEISNIKIVKQKIFDGTALGVARLISKKSDEQN